MEETSSKTFDRNSPMNVFVDAAVRSGRRSSDEEDAKKVSLEEILSVYSGGPPRFFSPIVEEEESEPSTSASERQKANAETIDDLLTGIRLGLDSALRRNLPPYRKSLK